MTLGAGHGDVDQGEVEVVGMCGDGAVEFVEIHRDHGLDAGIELGKLELHPFDDQAVVVRDEHFHCGTFMAGCLRACHVERGGARMAVTIFRARSGHQAASAMPTA